MKTSSRLRRLALGSALTFFLLGSTTTACVVVGPRPRAKAASTDKCPPGHRWSDGKCHERGKGHDPDKKRGKGRGKKH